MPIVMGQPLSRDMIHGGLLVSWTFVVLPCGCYLPWSCIKQTSAVPWAAWYDVSVLLITMTEEKRTSVRVWCDGWYGILFNVSCILPGAQRNVLCMVYVVKLPTRWG